MDQHRKMLGKEDSQYLMFSSSFCSVVSCLFDLMRIRKMVCGVGWEGGGDEMGTGKQLY